MTLRRAVAALLVAAVIVAGQAASAQDGTPGQVAVADDLPPGVEQVVVGDRAYLLAEPSAGGAGLPVVVLLHGRTDSASRFLGASGLLEWATDGAAVVTAPLTAAGLSPTSWNAGTCCDGAAADGVDDVDAVARVIADVAARTGADPARTSVVGFSNGAMLGYRVACERPGLLAGLVAVAGARLVPCPDTGGTWLLHVHGDGDTAVPLAGTAESRFTSARLPAAAESVAGVAGGRLDVVPGLEHRFTPDVAERAGAFLAGTGLLAVRDRSGTPGSSASPLRAGPRP
ncbi:MAG TPA: PHB depolymerase family esterase [Jiangellales bacterium]|nr:PHB depolymerase family esterase [Jiangellales bacterium]